MIWIQKQLTLPPSSSGVRLITQEILAAIPEIHAFKTGMLHVFLRHTSASLTLNENADPDVRGDLDRTMDRIVPQDLPFEHVLEGRDDMPAHVKSSLLGCSLSIPIGGGKLLLGTWQGIYLCEHRRATHRRSVVLTAFGEKAE